MQDIRPADVGAPGRPLTLTFYDGTTRTVVCTEQETAFPSGELIVSQTDPEGRITMCNEAFAVMSGYARVELLGEAHSILRHPDMPRAAFADLWTTIRQGTRWSGYVKNLRKDGGYYWVFATVIPRIRDGRIAGFTSVRRAPSRTKVAEAARSYAVLLDAERSAERATDEAVRQVPGVVR